MVRADGGRNDLRVLVGAGVIDPELAALVWLLSERGVPLVVGSKERTSAEELRRAFVDQIRAAQPARDAVAGGVVVGGSLEDILRVLGGGGEISDETRELGVVLVIAEGRVSVAHYVRPIERDAAGHLQRRPPAVLGARNERTGEVDHFYWAVTDELATRAGLTRAELETDLEARARLLSGPSAGTGTQNARH